MDSVILDYDADAKDRLWALLGTRNISQRNQLKQAVATAGAQLELMKPSLLGGSRDDFYAGPAVLSLRGTVLIVLAHEGKAFTMNVLPVSGHTLADVIGHAVDYAKNGNRGR